MAEVAPAGGSGANRAFLIIILGLAAVLVIGLIGAGTLFLLPGMLSPKTSASVVSITPTRVAIIAETATKPAPSSTPTPVLVALEATNTLTATATERPTQTSTENPTSAPAATSTSAAPTPQATPTPDTDANLPPTGLGDDLLVLGSGLVLIAVMFAARRARGSI